MQAHHSLERRAGNLVGFDGDQDRVRELVRGSRRSG
jgi:hypothetical protein